MKRRDMTLRSSIVVAITLCAPLAQAETPNSPAVEELIKSLGSTAFAEREQALDALASNRELAEKYAPALRKQLRDSHEASRLQAALALAAFGIGEQPVIDELLAGMGKRSPRGIYLSQPETARIPMRALVKLGPKAVPALVQALEDEPYTGRDLALEALGQIGPAAKDALPAVIRQLATDDVPMFCRAVEAKWRIDGDAAQAIGRLVPLLDQQRGRQVHAATHTLATMGADAKEAMPALVAALHKHRNHNVLWAVEQLAPHAKELALPALWEAMNSPATVDSAAIALQSLGEPAEELIPRQLKRLQASRPQDGSDPMKIIYTIVIHGPAARPYVDQVIALLKHENIDVRRAAAWGAPRMFADDQIVIPALTAALQDPETAEEAGKSLKMLREARQE